LLTSRFRYTNLSGQSGGNATGLAKTGNVEDYIFTDLYSAKYRVEFIPPAKYLFTVQNSAAATDALDSDASPADGCTPLISLAAGESNLTIDAGLYIPAEIFGYVFKDMDEDLICNAACDTLMTNMLVSLKIDDECIDTTYTSTNGYCKFVKVPLCVVTLQVLCTDGCLVNVPYSCDPMRNRAVSNNLHSAVTCKTVPGQWYSVMVSGELGPAAQWSVEYVSYVNAKGIWSPFDSQKFQGGPGNSTTVRVLHTRNKAFFKAVELDLD
jgi:hypothetical protein